MEGIIALLITIACGCIIPNFAIWMGVRKEMNETNTRTQIALAAIEKNPDMGHHQHYQQCSGYPAHACLDGNDVSVKAPARLL